MQTSSWQRKAVSSLVSRSLTLQTLLAKFKFTFSELKTKLRVVWFIEVTFEQNVKAWHIVSTLLVWKRDSKLSNHKNCDAQHVCKKYCFMQKPQVKFITPCYPLFPLVTLVIPCYPMLPFVTPFYPLLPFVTPFYPLLPLLPHVTPSHTRKQSIVNVSRLGSLDMSSRAEAWQDSKSSSSHWCTCICTCSWSVTPIHELTENI